MKKTVIAVLGALLAVLLLLTGCAGGVETETSGATEVPAAAETPYVPADIRVAALKGPTGMGISKLMADAADGKTANRYTVDLYSNPTDVLPLMVAGKADIAAVPTNAAAILYNKTEGKVKMLAVNTLGVLYFMEKGNTVSSLTDLAGKTVYTSGQGAVPEYALRYVLAKAGLSDSVKVVFLPEHSAVVSEAIAGKADIVLLPEPFVTALCAKAQDFRVAIDFNDCWKDACADTCAFSMGALVVRTAFAEEHPEAVAKFLEEYAASVAYVNENSDASAENIAALEITASAAVAKKAVPRSNIVCITGDEMKNKITPYLQILMESDPTSIGGKVPGEDFYFTK